MAKENSIWVGAFYNPHLGQEILSAGDLIDHLAMADPPRPDDPFFPTIQKKFILLLHDYIGQLSDPISDFAIARAKELADLYQSPWIAEHFQCVITQDGRYNVDYVFPPLYTQEFLLRYIDNAKHLVAGVGRPLAIENIPRYFETAFDEMTEQVFLRRFFEASNCGFILDLAHVWLGAYYRGRPFRQVLSEFPLEAVVELHIAGVDEYSDLDGPWIAPVEPTEEILDAAAWVMEFTPRLRAVTFDAFSTILKPGVVIRVVERIRRRLGLL